MDSSRRLLDDSACSVVLSVRQVGWLLEWSQLDRPDSFFDCLVGLLIAFASPKGLNDVLDTDDSFVAEQLFNDDVVRDGDPLLRLVLKVASLSHDFLENRLGRCTIAYIVLNEKQLLKVLSRCSHKSAIINLLEAELFQNFLCLRCSIS